MPSFVRKHVSSSIIITIGSVVLCLAAYPTAAGLFILGYTIGCVQFACYRMFMAVERRLTTKGPVERTGWRSDPMVVSLGHHGSALVVGSIVLLVVAGATAVEGDTLGLAAAAPLPALLLTLAAGLLSFGSDLAHSARKVPS